MLNLPKSTEYGRRVPKQMFYENLEVPPELKKLFSEQLRAVIWAHKLSPATMNIAPGQAVQEIEVFHLKLTGEALDERLLTLMDRQIPYHILYLLESAEGLWRLQIAYKEQSASTAFQVKRGFATGWQALERLAIPLSAADMDSFYDGIVRAVAGGSLSGAATLQQAVARTEEQERLQKQIAALTAKMKREKQLARQMELRRQVMSLKKELEEIK